MSETSKRPLVLDLFMYFNEDDLIVKRIKHLEDHVDYFIVVEGDYTHSGESKPLRFEVRHPILARHPKVVYIPHHLNFNSAYWCFQKWRKGRGVSWKIEGAQRNAVIPHLKRFSPTDIVMSGDLDEFPSLRVLEFINSHPEELTKTAHVCRQVNHIYSLGYHFEGQWHGTIVSSVADLVSITPKRLRSVRDGLAKIDAGGWHLSFFMDSEKISEKIRAFAHQEFDNEALAATDHVEWALENGVDLFGLGREILKTDTNSPEYDEISKLLDKDSGPLK